MHPHHMIALAAGAALGAYLGYSNVAVLQTVPVYSQIFNYVITL